MGNTWGECSIDIKNESSTYDFGNPCIHMVRGQCSNPLPPLIESNSSGSAQFGKTYGSPTGTVGVFTYDIINKSTKTTTGIIAVMFSVPYDYTYFDNLYAVGNFGNSQNCDYDLYRKMYYESHSRFVRGKATDPSITHTGDYVTIFASMSNAGQSALKVVVKDK
ncbi:hypothetical protein PFLUV_G00091420 [Perca fluviatilis]|uniref:Uncharacterized protein n=1 Tax=Perca fluviatilis TaxID=8168 RepID=A0A6A5F918_PERFL|nr:hypothetical protein PFLUV_G00091420 [Perca fluviatilis]